MKFVWDKINESKSKEWRRIYKALNLLEFLIKFGSNRCVSSAKDELFRLRTLQDFNYMDSGIERGSGIREKARSICSLLED